MNIFLYSPQKCLLSFNNEVFSLGKNLVKTTVLQNQPVTFDFNGRFETARYHCDVDFCKNVAITDLYGDFLCYPVLKPYQNFSYKNLLYKTIVVENVQYTLSVFTDGAVKLQIRGLNETLTVNLPFIPNDIDAYPVGGNLFLVDLKTNLHYIIIVSCANLSIEFSDICDEFTIDNKLSLTKTHSGIQTHREIKSYAYDGKVKLVGRTFQTFCSYEKIPEKIIPLAFLEEICLGADFTSFLTDELAKNAELLTEFFGKINFALPPFYKELPETYAIVSDNGVKYAKFTTENGKIADVSLKDYF